MRLRQFVSTRALAKQVINEMWQDFFEQQQYQYQDGQLTQAAALWGSPTLAQGFFTALTHTGVIQAEGDDAASFLHGQLSNDVEHLNQTDVRSAAYCTAKGRMLADFTYFSNAPAISLLTHRSILPAVLKRLQMFVLRAKAKLTDRSAELPLLALGGERAAAALQAFFPDLPAVGQQTGNQHGSLLRLADAGTIPRFIWVCPTAMLAQAWNSLAAQLTLASLNDWDLLEIEAGVAHINALISEKFVPQMINFELVGGVNFRKGCYPGQEIVARSQYLGKLKRRMTLARIPATGLCDGDEVFNSERGDQSCGLIVNVRPESASSSLALVEMTLADQEQGQLHCGSIDGPQLQLLPLPYEIRDITR